MSVARWPAISVFFKRRKSLNEKKFFPLVNIIITLFIFYDAIPYYVLHVTFRLITDVMSDFLNKKNSLLELRNAFESVNKLNVNK